jgi:hypothetical protein
MSSGFLIRSMLRTDIEQCIRIVISGNERRVQTRRNNLETGRVLHVTAIVPIEAADLYAQPVVAREREHGKAAMERFSAITRHVAPGHGRGGDKHIALLSP